MKKVLLVAGMAVAIGLGTAQAQNTLLPNPSLELDADTNQFPDNWFGFDSAGAGFGGAWVTSPTHDGTHALRFDLRAVNGPFEGIVAFRDDWTASAGGLKELMPVAAGSPISFSGWFASSGSDPMLAGAAGEIKIEWFNASKVQLSGANGATIQGFNNTTINAATWTQMGVSTLAPTGAAFAKFVVVGVNRVDGQGNPLDSGAFFVDDLVAVPEPSSVAMLVGGLALMGLTIRRFKK